MMCLHHQVNSRLSLKPGSTITPRITYFFASLLMLLRWCPCANYDQFPPRPQNKKQKTKTEGPLKGGGASGAKRHPRGHGRNNTRVSNGSQGGRLSISPPPNLTALPPPPLYYPQQISPLCKQASFFFKPNGRGPCSCSHGRTRARSRCRQRSSSGSWRQAHPAASTRARS